MRRPRLDLTKVRKRILFRLHLALIENKNINARVSSFNRYTGDTREIIELAIVELENDGSCLISDGKFAEEDPSTGTTYQSIEDVIKITTKGIEAVEKWTDSLYQEIAKSVPLSDEELVTIFNDDQLDADSPADDIQQPAFSYVAEDLSETVRIYEDLGLLEDESTEESLPTLDEADTIIRTAAIPASDRIVQLDHNSETHISVVEKLNELKELVASNNEYRSNDLEDHERRLTDLESSVKLLETSRVRVSTISTASSGTLVYLSKKFAEGPIGELAALTWRLLKQLLGI
jgi:hypothetical protein